MKKKTKENLIWFLPTIFVIFLLLMIKFCTPKINEKYIVEKIKKENIELFIDTKGKVEGKDFVNIGLDIQLNVDEIYFKEGDKVKKGDVLMRFSDYKAKEMENKLNDRKEAISVKKSQLRYLQKQYSEGTQVRQQILQLTGEILALENEIKIISKENELIQRVILSPIDGYIVKINAIKGNTTDTTIPVLILANSMDLKIVSEPVKLNNLDYIIPGNEARIQSKKIEKITVEKDEKNKNIKNNNNEDNFQTFKATLYKINNTGIENVKTLEFLTNSFKDIVMNEELSIRLYYQKRENILTVPINAILTKKIGKIEKQFIYLIDKENRITEKEVQIGINNGEKVEIIGKDLEVNQEIIANPNDKLQNRVIVKRRSLEDEKNDKKKRLEKLEKDYEKKKIELEKMEREIILLKRNK